MSETVIYGLFEPGTTELRYVGKTSMGLAQRLRAHRSFARNDPATPVHKWMADGNMDVEIVELTHVRDDEDWKDVEHYWIKQCKFCGYDLLNAHPGGGHFPHKWREMSEDHKKAISEGLYEFYENNEPPQKGHVHSEEHKKAISDGLNRYWEEHEHPGHPEERREKIAESVSKETRMRGPRGDRQYKGVYKHSTGSGFTARIQNDYIGYFSTAEEAARAYDREARKRYGSECYLNFPDDIDDVRASSIEG